MSWDVEELTLLINQADKNVLENIGALLCLDHNWEDGCNIYEDYPVINNKIQYFIEVD